MLKKTVILLSTFSLLSCGFMGCSDDNNDPETSSLALKLVKSDIGHQASTISENDLAGFVQGQYDLNFDLLRNSTAQIGDQNAMISTFSLQSASGMLWAAAANDTKEEMAKALHFDDHTHSALNKLNSLVMAGRRDAVEDKDFKQDAVDINVTNDLYASPSYQWKADWLDLLAKEYDAGITEMDFAADPEAARKYINDVVAKDTHDRIKDLLPPTSIDVQTQAVLTNAIYFKAPWANEFHAGSAKVPFTKKDNSSVDVDVIRGTGYWDYNKSDDYEAALIPLRGQTFSILFVLPNDIDALLANANGQSMVSILDSLKQQDVNVTIPKFQFETNVKLSDPLKALGMNKAFTPSADFSLMTEKPNEIFISEVYHKTFVGLNEDGVEAAAATAIVAKDNAIPMPEVNFDLNRPFVFVIIENKSETPLFVGRVMNPAA